MPVILLNSLVIALAVRDLPVPGTQARRYDFIICLSLKSLIDPANLAKVFFKDFTPHTLSKVSLLSIISNDLLLIELIDLILYLFKPSTNPLGSKVS